MRPVSDRLKNIVTGSHTARTRIRTVKNFPQSTNPAGSYLTVISGDVKMDSSAVVRATLDCEVIAPWGSIYPDGTELLVEYGVEVAGGSTEWISLGYFGIDDVTQNELHGPLRISASDRMQQAVRTEAVFPWVAPAGTTHADFFSSLMYGQNPATWFHPNAGVLFIGASSKNIIYDYDAGTTTIPYQIPLDAPFQELMQRVASTIDKRIFFDYLGRLNVVDADVVNSGQPATAISAGHDGVLRGMSRQITRDGVYNSVRAEGSAPTEGSPAWGYDFLGSSPTDPGLPALSWFGPFGRVLKTFTSPLLTNGAECLAAADSIQSKVTGLTYSLSMDIVPNPALEPLDVIVVNFPGPGPSSTPPKPGMKFDPRSETHVIDSLTFPLAGGDMSITTRGATVLP